MLKQSLAIDVRMESQYTFDHSSFRYTSQHCPGSVWIQDYSAIPSVIKQNPMTAYCLVMTDTIDDMSMVKRIILTFRW
jgi:hypothetical protein